MYKQRGACPRGTDGARVIQVIETKSLRGRGTEEDPCRPVFQYWSFDGEKLAENDPCLNRPKEVPSETTDL